MQTARSARDARGRVAGGEPFRYKDFLVIYFFVNFCKGNFDQHQMAKKNNILIYNADSKGLMKHKPKLRFGSAILFY